MIQRKNIYEGMYIVNSTLNDEGRKKALEKVLSGITERGGEILKIHEMGRKRLAYNINGNREGVYFLIYFSIDPDQIVELWDDYRLHQDLIRFITLKADSVMEKIEFKSLVEQ